MRKTFVCITLVLLTVCLFVGCSSSPKEEPVEEIRSFTIITDTDYIITEKDFYEDDETTNANVTIGTTKWEEMDGVKIKFVNKYGTFFYTISFSGNKVQLSYMLSTLTIYENDVNNPTPIDKSSVIENGATYIMSNFG